MKLYIIFRETAANTVHLKEEAEEKENLLRDLLGSHENIQELTTQSKEIRRNEWRLL